MIRQIFRVFLAVAILTLAACITTGGVPSWVFVSPENTSEYHYFVGVGSDISGDSVRAYEEASGHIISQIIDYIGVSPSDENTAFARSEYEQLTADLSAALQLPSEGGAHNIAGAFRLVERWDVKDGDRAVVHLLTVYDQSRLKAEKVRLTELFEKKIETVGPAERAGDGMNFAGHFYEAAQKYIEAALEASVSGEKDSARKFERSLLKAQNSVRRLSLEITSVPSPLYVGEEPGSSFAVKLDSGGTPEEGVPVKLSYKALNENGRKSDKSMTVLTDENGTAYFRIPPPQWTGIEKAVFTVDMDASVLPLEDVDFELLKFVDGLEAAIFERQVDTDFEVFSRAIEVPTCVMIMDVDRSGNPLDKTDTAEGVVSVLKDAGFNVTLLPVDYRMTAVSDSELVQIVKEEYGDICDRLIFGTAEISSYEEAGGVINIKVAGRIKAIEVESGRLLFSASEQKGARGGNNSSTITAAFLSLGKVYGNRLLSDLP